ncbi:phenoloxidase-activating factor 2-like [Drosophila rhopaloa]|uniref:Serine protease 55-like n=1 Tax=Drosophila rhopaloa TaxID=1041015 RepID=A0A6P4FIH9_DRORH|nr:phenoloxidase-activating factor 2-like [Drosophila rhopaloa]
MEDVDDIAEEYMFPWMMALLETSGNYVGGGTLLSAELVITAQHLTDNRTKDQLIVRAGEWDFRTDSEQFRHVDASILLIVRHPEFNKNNGANNVALLFLRTPLTLTNHIKPICLLAKVTRLDYKRCNLSGWGKKTSNDKENMKVLKRVDLPVVQNNMCESIYRKYYGNEFNLDNSGAQAWSLVRTLAEDFCGLQDFPGVYTNVARFQSWINEKIMEFEPEPESKPLLLQKHSHTT